MVQLNYNLDDISAIAVKPGRYRARLIKCEQTLSSTKNPMLVWYWKITSGEEKGKEVRSFTSLLETALVGLKNHLEAFDFSGKVDLDTSNLVGKSVTLVIGLREGKNRDGISQTFSAVVGVLSSKQKSKKVEEEDVDDDFDDEEEYEDEIEDDEEDEVEEEEPPKKRRRKPKAKQKRLPF